MTDLQPVVTGTGTVTGTVTIQNDTKPAWQSKTLWASALTVLLPLVWPPAAVFIAANPTLVPVGLGVLFGVLRVVTKGAVTIA